MEETNKNRDETLPKTEGLTYTVEKGIGTLLLNTKMNAISIPTAEKIIAALKDAEKNPKVKAVLIRSEGTKVFSAGFDLSIFKNGFSEKVKRDLLVTGRDVSRSIFFLSKPVIVRIQGPAIGLGSIIALSADFRIVANKKDIFFQLPEIDLNIYPATGPVVSAVYSVGPVHALDMLMTGRKVFLEEMKQWGALTKIVEPEELDKEVKNFAKTLARKNPMIMKMIKPTVRMIAMKNALQWYDLENDMADYFIDTVMGKSKENLDKYIASLWKKYSHGNPLYDE